MGKTLYEKVWDAHAVRTLPNGQTQLLIGTHLIHEVTSPQAFGMLRDLGLRVRYPGRTFATVDHIVPTDRLVEPFDDPLADAILEDRFLVGGGRDNGQGQHRGERNQDRALHRQGGGLSAGERSADYNPAPPPTPSARSAPG